VVDQRAVVREEQQPRRLCIEPPCARRSTKEFRVEGSGLIIEDWGLEIPGFGLGLLSLVCGFCVWNLGCGVGR